MPEKQSVGAAAAAASSVMYIHNIASSAVTSHGNRAADRRSDIETQDYASSPTQCADLGYLELQPPPGSDL
ncbi:hypothetical protein CP532_6725, partial [Ophiocordyceps camponoti-leonardi (nom. inval.)]